jgi:nucleoside-diphosphate-sugar epimerase
MSRILVTGASGFIGRPCLPRLRDAGFEVCATSRSSGPPIEGVRWIPADLLATGEGERVLREVRPTHLLHLAWYVVPGKFWTAEENRAWLDASRSLIAAAVRCGVRRAVVAGTGFEYDFTSGFCDEATTPLAPSTLYAQSKAALREAIADMPGIDIAWARIFWQYGPHEDPDRLAASVIRSLLSGLPAVCRTPDLRRPFLHVGDVASGLAALSASEITGPVNIVADEPVRIGDLVETAARLVGRPDLVRFEAAPTTDPPSIAASNIRLRSTGWSPEHSLETGLADTIAWWRHALETNA